MSQYKPKQYWNNAAKTANVRYDYIADDWAETDKFIDILEANNTNWGKVLEIGCGIGRLLKPLSDIYPKCKLYGYDISQEMINRAAKARNIKYSTEFTGSDLDLVYSMLVFQHITNEDKEAYIAKSYEALKTGGVFLMQFVVGSEYAPYSYQTNNEHIKDLLHKHKFKHITFTQTDMHPDWSIVRAVK